MHYLKFGTSKKFLVFLHGWGADMNSFLWLKDFFADDHTLLFIDFAGFGKTAEPSVAWSVCDYANDLKSLLDSFEIDSIIFVAHSFGGRVALKFLSCYQDIFDVRGLCLVDSAGILPRRNILYWWKIYRFKRLKRRAVKKVELRSKLDEFGSSDYKKLSDTMKNTFVKVVNEDLSNAAKSVGCKTLIVWGKKDKETKLYMAKKLHKFIKQSKLVIFRDAGHFSFLEKKEDFVIVLDTFIKSL